MELATLVAMIREDLEKMGVSYDKTKEISVTKDVPGFLEAVENAVEGLTRIRHIEPLLNRDNINNSNHPEDIRARIRMIHEAIHEAV